MRLNLSDAERRRRGERLRACRLAINARAWVDESTKICAKCRLPKNVSEYYSDSVAGSVRSRCKGCLSAQSRAYHSALADRSHIKARAREYYAKNKNKISARRKWRGQADRERYMGAIFKSVYGISYAEREEMAKRQDGRCAICRAPETSLKKRLNIDHCHATKRVRGLLCYNCNRALGLFKDSAPALRLAAQYLECPGAAIDHAYEMMRDR